MSEGVFLRLKKKLMLLFRNLINLLIHFSDIFWKRKLLFVRGTCYYKMYPKVQIMFRFLISFTLYSTRFFAPSAPAFSVASLSLPSLASRLSRMTQGRSHRSGRWLESGGDRRVKREVVQGLHRELNMMEDDSPRVVARVVTPDIFSCLVHNEVSLIAMIPSSQHFIMEIFPNA